MDIRNIKRFLALCDHRSFSKASEFLAISQPSLTREIQKMEEDIGHKLFVRLPSGVELTPTGEIYKQSFGKIVKELEQAEVAADTLGNEIFGKIGIACHPVIGRTLAPLIEPELGEYPALEIDYRFMNSRDAIEEVTHYRCDFALVASTFKHRDIKKITLWTENINLYSRSGKKEEVILANKGMLNAEKILKKIGAKKVRWVNDYGVLLTILEKNNVMGLLPNTMEIRMAKLKSLGEFPPTFEISLIFRTDMEKTAAHRWLIDMMKEKCAELAH